MQMLAAAVDFDEFALLMRRLVPSALLSGGTDHHVGHGALDVRAASGPVPSEYVRRDRRSHTAAIRKRDSVAG